MRCYVALAFCCELTFDRSSVVCTFRRFPEGSVQNAEYARFIQKELLTKANAKLHLGNCHVKL